MSYDTMDPRDGIERRWLDHHIWDVEGDETIDTPAGRGKPDVTAIAESMISHLEDSRQDYDVLRRKSFENAENRH